MTQPLTKVIAEAGRRITQAVNAKVISERYMYLAADLHRAAHEIHEHMLEESGMDPAAQGEAHSPATPDSVADGAVGGALPQFDIPEAEWTPFWEAVGGSLLTTAGLFRIPFDRDGFLLPDEADAWTNAEFDAFYTGVEVGIAVVRGRYDNHDEWRRSSRKARLVLDAQEWPHGTEAAYDTEKGPTAEQVADSRFLERERGGEPAA